MNENIDAVGNVNDTAELPCRPATPNEVVYTPVVAANGIREPKTAMHLQPLGGRILCRGVLHATVVEINGLLAKEKNEENALLKRGWDKVIVVGHGPYCSQVLIGDEIKLADDYSIALLPMFEDPLYYKNVAEQLAKDFKHNELVAKHPIIATVDPYQLEINRKAEVAKMSEKHEIHLYFECEEYALAGRVIKFPNATL
jgi:hypothetical protein